MTSHHVSVPSRFPHRGDAYVSGSQACRVWALFKADRAVECEITEHASGHEVRVYLGGELYYRRMDTSRAAADTQAANLKHVLLADGWIHR